MHSPAAAVAAAWAATATARWHGSRRAHTNTDAVFNGQQRWSGPAAAAELSSDWLYDYRDYNYD